MGKQEFLFALEKGIAEMRKTGSEVTLVHHNDADGLASAAVMQTALTRADFSVRRIPLERVLPPIIERIHEQFSSTILYVDLGAKGAPAISEANHGQRLTLIVAHRWFSNDAPKVPGLGTFDWSSYKASMRVPSLLEEKIVVDKEMPGLAYLVPAAARQVGGSIDACHDYAAATVIDIGREEELIEAMEELVEQP